jgi:RNA polymerase sigma-70 factor (ECF subfamily)
VRRQFVSREGTVVANSDLPLQLAPARETATRAPAAKAETADARQGDYQLVQRLIVGDGAAWRAFVERFGRLVLSRVLATAREMTQSLTGQDAEDLCADVFSQLVARGYWRSPGSRAEHALDMAVRRDAADCRAAIGQAARYGRRQRSVAWRRSVPVRPRKSADADNWRRGRALLKAALGAERAAAQWRLFYIDGCSYREISQKLDMPMNSVGPTLNRIHAKLRAALTREE